MKVNPDLIKSTLCPICRDQVADWKLTIFITNSICLPPIPRCEKCKNAMISGGWGHQLSSFGYSFSK